MPTERKTGLLQFTGDQPMELVTSTEGETTEPWSDAQEALAKAVRQAVDRYLAETESLSTGKYKHLEGKIPAYLSNPGNVIMVICDDGVVIRYEKRTADKQRKVIFVMPKSIVDVAAFLSQNLVHHIRNIQTNRSLH